MGIYSKLIRPVLFRFDPEEIHLFVFGALKWVFKIPGVRLVCNKIFNRNDPRLDKKILGIHFPNPIGLAAGLDKNGKLFNELSAFGFGFIEVGTVTPLAQQGNEKPRMFRLPDDEALINRMGFNNEGVQAMAALLEKRDRNIIIGCNIGKNKNTPNEKAIDDYETCFRVLFPFADFFVVNVSSPNTPGLRALQDKGPLTEILIRLRKINSELAAHKKGKENCQKPILLKISPDLTNEQLDEIIEVVFMSGIEGIVATNTTISREELKTPSAIVLKAGAGGLSGKPLRKRSTDIIRYLAKHSQNKFAIIGVGGIHSPEDALEKLRAGADLIQLYTGFIYEGPGLIKGIKEKLLNEKK